MKLPTKDEPGHCMYCDRPLPANRVSGYCSCQCEKMDEWMKEPKPKINLQLRPLTKKVE